MEIQNKHWVCHPILDNNGQLGPEDLSSTNKTLQNRPPASDKRQNLSSNAQQITVDCQNKNGLDQIFVQQVEDAICENSRQVILHILEEVTRLTSVEKLLLYLKLPTDLNNVSDPLRQPLNPLGSRTEISQTIMWIRTHLEEDPELSLPKQDVYNEYNVHCASNKMKPLSTADFGKVMKQVYPRVRPRRLGTRGNSRYCYAGLRKRFKLEVPQMPDLGDRPQSTETVCSPSEMTTAACVIVCEWAENVLSANFQSIQALASYLLTHAPQAVSMRSGAASLLTTRLDALPVKADALLPELPYSNHVNLKHKETQLQLQRKLQQKDVKRKLQLQSPKAETKGKCKKSKFHGSGPPSRSASQDSQESSDSPKSQGYPLNTVCDKPANEYMNAPALPDFSSFQMKKPDEGRLGSDKPSAAKKDVLDVSTTDYQIKLAKPVSDTDVSRCNSLENELYDVNHISDEAMPELKQNIIRKLPIPKLPIPKIKTGAPKQLPQQPRKGHRNLKYKAIQPKPVKCDTKTDITQGHTEPNLDAADVIPITSDDSLKNTDYLTRERLISVSNVDKDALDDYLHGGNNSQEQEEELMQYFKNNEKYDGAQPNISSTQLDHDDSNNTSKSDKLSQLRILLEQNFSANLNMVHAPTISNAKIQKSAELITNLGVVESNTGMIMKPIEKHAWSQATPLNSLPPNLNLQTHLNSAVKRRVSFETSVIDNDTVPPSPNTRRKNFSFTPISPGPHSPGGGRQSKCSSTNASPFVSPRNTPVPRAKCTHVQNQPVPSFVAQQITQPNRKQLKPLKTALKHESDMYNEPEKIFGDFIEEKHFVNPTDIIPKYNLPMSAPPSPMLPFKQKNNNTNLLQKLLDSTSKVPYVPNYDKSIPHQHRQSMHPTVDSLSQEVSQLLSENNPQVFSTTENTYRSQSVPLHQMTSFKTLMSPCLPNSQHNNFNFTSASNSVAPTPVSNEFTEFEPFPELNTGLNNENLNQILNILETSQGNPIDETVPTEMPSETSQTTENVFTFETGASNILNANILNQAPTDPGQLLPGEMISVQKLMRSHSHDVDVDMRAMCKPKFMQSSRSVPSTPLPFNKSKLELELNLNNNQQPDMAANVFACSQDFLLNGQPVKEKFSVQREGDPIELSQGPPRNFPQSLGFTMNESVTDNKSSNFVRGSGEYFGARRNLNTLLELQYPDSDFQATVPKVNSDT